MKNLPITTPDVALTELKNIFIPENTPKDSFFELSIRITDQDLTIRDLSAFLDFIDRIYGRLSEKGLRSYANSEHGHLRISELRKGSWELLLEEAITSGYSHALVIILIAVKYLPPAVESFANAYSQIEQGRLASANRRRITKEMKQDNQLAVLGQARINQLSMLLEYLYQKEDEKLYRTIRFVKTRLIDINIRVKRKN
ncbi:MAG TPA: hypothetical protein PL131_06645 [Methylotenera sp.]|nr:hypothetical protein [Methylotenera sp.]HPH05537.1 hypothetical protein [Methylotenera sp.]HPN00049.1 hypothetical protein [Methylotenera sp.]